MHLIPGNLTVLFGAYCDPDVSGHWSHPGWDGLQVGLKRPSLPRVLTCDFGLEGAAHDVLGTAILDGNEVVSRGHGSVSDHVALRTLPTVQLHLGGAINGDRQSPRARVQGIDDELG